MMCFLTRVIAIPRFLRVREINVDNSLPGRHFMKCTCCERTKIGVPCSCFFRIARDANIPYDKIMDVGMFDVRYTKLFNSHYSSKDKTMANMIYEAQKVRTRNGWFYIRFAFTSKHTYIHFLLTSKSTHNLFTSNSNLHPFLFTSIF